MRSLEIRLTRRGRFAGGSVYIGRPSRLGNPYRVEETGSREEAVRLYRAWFQERTKDPRFLETLEALYERLKREGVLTLSCYCAPLPCHGEVIARWLVERGEKEGRRVRVQIEGR